jgi:hypothetical protein
MPNPQIVFPANFTPASALAYAATDNSAQLVSAAAPLPVTMGSALASLEPAGAAITGTTMPAGGTGLTGWLSAIYKACAEPATVSGSATSAATVVSGHQRSGRLVPEPAREPAAPCCTNSRTTM